MFLDKSPLVSGSPCWQIQEVKLDAPECKIWSLNCRMYVFGEHGGCGRKQTKKAETQSKCVHMTSLERNYNLVSDPRGSQVVQLPMGEIVKYGGIWTREWGVEKVRLVERKWEQIQQVCKLRGVDFADFTPPTVAQGPLCRAGHSAKHLWGWVSHL